MSVCHTINMNSLSICQPHDASICHTNIMTSPSVCPSYQLSDYHTITMACPSVCQSKSFICLSYNHLNYAFIHALSVQPICTLCITSAVAPICASPIPSIQPSVDKHQEFLNEFPGTKYGGENPIPNNSKIP